jgi:sugar phosphate isomerase/epimerase
MSKAFEFGMPSLIELGGLAENLKLCRELGLSFVELNMNMPMFQLSELYKVKSEPDIELTLHLPEELNVWDFNEKVRTAYVETCKEIIVLCEKLQIKVINMHMNKGVYFTLPDRKVYLFCKYRDVYLDRTENFAKIISDMIGGTEIVVCIENTGIYENSFIVEAVDVLLSYPGFNLTWDIGHDFGTGQKDTAYIKTHLDKLKHVHLHDAIGEQNHLSLGSGDIPVKRILTELPNRVERIVLETKTMEGLRKSIVYLKTQNIC